MNRNKTLTLAAAALSGMFVGASARAATVVAAGVSGTSQQVTGTAGQRAIPMDAATHDCKGKNSCKGQGGCKTGDNGCKGKNSCKGAGGCKTAAATTMPGL